MTYEAVRDGDAMIAAMKPVLVPGTFFFCSTADESVAEICAKHALMVFKEDEGVTLILDQSTAEVHGFDTSLPMSRIVLEVFSALDGVGLTAAVATTLAARGISCNVVAAFHHDNVFVPLDRANEALEALKSRQQQT